MPIAQVAPRVLLTNGASYEGDVFSVAKFCEFILRAAEFGLADGAIDCKNRYSILDSWIDRFWQAHEGRYEEPSQLLLFEVKSTVGETAGEQVYKTNEGQRKHVAFFIGLVAGEPGSIDLIPNYHQSPEALRRTDDEFISGPDAKRAVTVNVGRKSYLPSGAYGGVDQCLTPYRMPIGLLPQALDDIRRCVLEGGVYTNPWSKVTFHDWHPQTTTQMRFLRPCDIADQASAFEALLEVYRIIKHDPRAREMRLEMDFLGMQPRLGDFKFILSGNSQRLIQHKLDPVLHSKGYLLRKVPIARDGGPERQYYFSAFNRFDFLWYQFEFSKGGGEVERVFYFIPDRELPDEFFTSEEHEISFEDYPHFSQYRIAMDDDRNWVTSICRILAAFPEPRAERDRPLRSKARKALQAHVGDTQTQTNIASAASKQHHGRRLFAHEMRLGRREFFYQVMAQCARRRSGLLVVLATEHPYGDFGFCRYRWTSAEAHAFRDKGKPPRAGHHLPPDTELIPVFFFTQYAEAAFQGPNLRARHFRRLDTTDCDRLTIWSIAGPDATTTPFPLAVIPTADINPSDMQRDLFDSNLKLDKKQEHEKKNPNLSALLSTALYAGEYSVGPAGPLAYDEVRGVWEAMWTMLYAFLVDDQVEHPDGFVRSTLTYRHTLQSVNQKLSAQHLSDQDLDNDDAHEDYL